MPARCCIRSEAALSAPRHAAAAGSSAVRLPEAPDDGAVRHCFAAFGRLPIKAITRTTPSLLTVFSIVTLIAAQLRA
jgi:hypothetical protein